MRFGALLIKRFLMVAPTSFISWCEALCKSMATGGAEASAIAMILPDMPFIPQAGLWDEWHHFKVGVFRGRPVPK
jgi:hypothetical protein